MEKIFYNILPFCTCITGEWGFIRVFAVPSSPTYRGSTVPHNINKLNFNNNKSISKSSMGLLSDPVHIIYRVTVKFCYKPFFIRFLKVVGTITHNSENIIIIY